MGITKECDKCHRNITHEEIFELGSMYQKASYIFCGKCIDKIEEEWIDKDMNIAFFRKKMIEALWKSPKRFQGEKCKTCISIDEVERIFNEKEYY